MFVCVAQAEGILRAWATPALQKDYGSDPVATKLWNTTMTEVEKKNTGSWSKSKMSFREIQRVMN